MSSLKKLYTRGTDQREVLDFETQNDKTTQCIRKTTVSYTLALSIHDVPSLAIPVRAMIRQSNTAVTFNGKSIP